MSRDILLVSSLLEKHLIKKLSYFALVRSHFDVRALFVTKYNVHVLTGWILFDGNNFQRTYELLICLLLCVYRINSDHYRARRRNFDTNLLTVKSWRKIESRRNIFLWKKKEEIKKNFNDKRIIKLISGRKVYIHLFIYFSTHNWYHLFFKNK